MIEQLIPLTALDALDLPFVVFDDGYRPRSLSASAARILEIQTRHHLDPHEATLQPLTELCLASRKRGDKGSLIPDSIGGTTVVSLMTTANRSFSALAYCRMIQGVTAPGTEEEQLLHKIPLVLFHPLDALEPFLHLVEQTRRTRALSVLAGSELEHRFTLTADDAPQSRVDAATDLSKVLTNTVALVDQMIVSSTKMLLDIKTSALIACGRRDAIRILAHLLLDGADFAGPGGAVKVRLALDSVEQPKRRVRERDISDELSTPCAEVVVLSERPNTTRSLLGPFEHFLHHLVVPNNYRVSVRDGEHAARETKDLPLKGLLHQRYSASALSRNTVTQETLSENLRIAHLLAERSAATILVRPLQHNLLTLSVRFPLSGSAL